MSRVYAGIRRDGYIKDDHPLGELQPHLAIGPHALHYLLVFRAKVWYQFFIRRYVQYRQS